MDGYITIGTELDTKEFDKQIDYIENKMEEIATVLESEKASPTMDASDIKKMEAEYEKLGNQLTQLKKKKRELEGPESTSGILDFLKNAGVEIENNVKKVGKWALAVFGVRGAYSMVRQAMSTISQYDTQLATDIEYMKFALANTLKPVIETIVNLAYNLLALINSISVSLFGVNLFANASAEAFINAKKGLSGANKSAKELKKTLAGFDEMNILQDNGSTTIGGGGGGVTMPSFDLGIQSFEKQGEQIKKFTSEMTNFWENDWTEALGLVDGKWEIFWDGIILMGKGFYDAFSGIIQTVIGIVDVFVSIFNGDMEGVERGFKKMGDGIVTFALGVFEIIGGIFTSIMGIFYAGAVNIKQFFTDAFQTVYNKLLEFSWKVVSVFDTVRSFFKDWGTKVGEAVGGAFRTVINAVLNWAETQLNKPISSINSMIEAVNKLPGVNVSKIARISLPRLAQGGIVNMPTSGVMVGSAIAGERGAEGVIPLTDSQQMALLGEAIGKYITINANITNTMNGRVISRELQKVQNESNFAFNR